MKVKVKGSLWSYLRFCSSSRNFKSISKKQYGIFFSFKQNIGTNLDRSIYFPYLNLIVRIVRPLVQSNLLVLEPEGIIRIAAVEIKGCRKEVR